MLIMKGVERISLLASIFKVPRAVNSQNIVRETEKI
jgi:hypothetical protein